MSRAPLWRSTEQMPPELGPTAVTIGNFDGVHRGHRAVLARLREEAARRDLAPVALTFWPHPRHVCVRAGEPPLLTRQDDRDRLLLLEGLAGVLDLDFTWDFAQLSPEEFVRLVLVEGMGMRCIVMGGDSRFGRANAGDLATMQQLGRELGFDVVTVADLPPAPAAPCPPGPDTPAAPGPGPSDTISAKISSSAIRAAILEGDVVTAAQMLGRLHTVTDVVHHGFKRGRELGFPTANLGPDPAGLVPGDGVYAGFLTVVEQAPEHRGTPPLAGAPATISIGTNPTFAPEDGGPAPRMVEAYVHTDADLDLYGDTVRLEFVARQRPTVCFDSVPALIEQMNSDKDVTRRTLAAHSLGERPAP